MPGHVVRTEGKIEPTTGLKYALTTCSLHQFTVRNEIPPVEVMSIKGGSVVLRGNFLLKLADDCRLQCGDRERQRGMEQSKKVHPSGRGREEA